MNMVRVKSGKAHFINGGLKSQLSRLGITKCLKMVSMRAAQRHAAGRVAVVLGLPSRGASASPPASALSTFWRPCNEQ